MQVNLSANLSNPAGETNAKPAEVAQEGAADGFFAQMGKILNQGNEKNKAQAAPDPSVPPSKSAEKNARRLLQVTSLLSPQALTVGQAPVQNVSSALSQPFHGSADNTQAQDAGAAQAIARKSGGITLASGKDSIPVLVRNAEKGIADLPPSYRFPGDSGAAASVPPPVMDADSDNLRNIAGVNVNTGGHAEYPTKPKGDAIQNLQMLDMQKENAPQPEWNIAPEAATGRRAEDPTKPTGDAIQNFQMLGMQKENAPQPEWNIAPEAAETVNDLVVSRNSLRQIQDPRAALQAGMENTPQLVSGYARPGNETDLCAVPQDQALSAQLKFDFIAAGTAALRQGMPGQPAGSAERQDQSFSDNFALSENAGLPIDDSPVTILRKSLKPMLASPENSDAAKAVDPQGQTLDKARPLMSMQGKLEHGQLNTGRQQLSSAERQSQVQSVFASSPAQNRELADAVSAPPAQSSTSQEPELYFQLADQIRIQLRDGKGEIRIQLKPDSLGRLEIRAENTAHGVSARISTDSGAVKSYLENNLQLLQQTLQDQGLKIDRIHIVVQDAFDSQSSSGYTAQFGHAGSGQNGKEPQLFSGKSSASHMNPIDETNLDSASWFALNPNSRFHTIA